jgi:circadian clock protein KaiC
MSELEGYIINKITTGVPGLDETLGGGLPEYSFNLVAGDPGSGKTTMVQQMIFHMAEPERPALYFTVLGEPTFKMLRYQQQMSFFHKEKIGREIHYINLSDDLLHGGFGKVLATIKEQVEKMQPAFVVVDSFRTVIRSASSDDFQGLPIQAFVQDLAIFLTSWQATTFLIGEYVEGEIRDNPVFTVADGIIWLAQNRERNSVVRKMQIIKMRGQATMPGLHTFRITSAGIQVFPRIPQHTTSEDGRDLEARLSSGIRGLDEMIGGGFPSGDSILVAGPSGAGKTVMATQFIAEGIKQGERGVILIFEEFQDEYLSRAKKLGVDLQAMVASGDLRIIYLRPLDLSVDEALQELQDAARQIGAKRVVIDSLSGFELALAPTFREDFRESLYRMVAALVGSGVTVLMTIEVTDSFNELRFSPHNISFLTDDVILLRYSEIAGRLKKVIAVVKTRRSSHSDELRSYEINEKGIEIGEALSNYRGIITGVPVIWETDRLAAYPGLTNVEITVLQSLEKEGPLTAEGLAQQTGISLEDVASALQRIVSLSYAVRAGKGSDFVYRSAARR